MIKGDDNQEVAQLKTEVARLKADKLRLMLAVRIMLSSWERSPFDRENAATCALDIMNRADVGDRPQ